MGVREWEDPLSFRKATLFGLSTGVTLWSLLWVISKLEPHRWDGLLRYGLCVALVIEVGLISLQTWRGETSHFNRSGAINQAIETGMTICITLAMLGILWVMTLVTLGRFQSGIAEETKEAIRWGMGFLLVSGLLGYAITGLGYTRISQGDSPGIWPPRGVLKFPHGAALHAIQVLGILAWWTQRAGSTKGVRIVRIASLAHALWLVFAVYQTANGHARFEMDPLGLVFAIATFLCAGWVFMELVPTFRHAVLGPPDRP